MKISLLLFQGTTPNACERTVKLNGITRVVSQEEVRCHFKTLGFSNEQIIWKCSKILF